MGEKIFCIYHSKDLDGWMSAAIVKLKYPNCELIGWNYGDPLPEKIVSSPYLDNGGKLILVDISFKNEDMLNLNRIYDVIWIDHHQRTIIEVEKYFQQEEAWQKEKIELKGLRDSKFAACELSWKYFFSDKPMPEIVRLLGRYDCFGHKGTEEELKVLEFQYGARQCIDSPEGALIYLNLCLEEKEYDETVYKIWANGRAIYQYLCTEARQAYATRFNTFFGEYKFACVNKERFNPVNFGIDYHKDGYDGFCSFSFDGKKWVYSLYNDNGLVDCSAIAKAYGGGGHKGASGFQTEELELVKIIRNERI